MEENTDNFNDVQQAEEKRRFVEELDVVKKGYLHIKRPPTNIKLRLKVCIFFTIFCICIKIPQNMQVVCAFCKPNECTSPAVESSH